MTGFVHAYTSSLSITKTKTSPKPTPAASSTKPLAIMTLSKPSTQSSTTKMAKAVYGAAKLSPKVQFNLTSATPAMTAIDCCLQSTSTKRRYMRRGSKCPSMILKAMQKEIFEHGVIFNEHKQLNDGQQRRLSLMTALKVSLERVSILEKMPEEEADDTEHSTSSDDVCRITYDILTEASEL